MVPATLPRILSPNLGCPEIVSPEALFGTGIRVVLALPSAESPSGQGYLLKAECSYTGEGASFNLTLGDATELSDDTLPEKFDDVSDSRQVLSTTLRTAVFEGKARFWSFRVRADKKLGSEYLRQTEKGSRRATLYDLGLYRGSDLLSTTKHAIFLRPSSATVRFIHLTDLHTATRNDLWAKEIKSIVYPVPTDRQLKFINFNDHLRKFIGRANEFADSGELDFVLALGDLVDFIQLGIQKGDPGPNNWQGLLELLLGSSDETARGNRGLRVPLFTTLGNHDWRPYPYPPEVNAAIFGLNSKEASQFDYLYHDTSEVVGKRIAEVHSQLISEGSPILAETWWRSVVGWGLRRIELGIDHLSTRIYALVGKYAWTLISALLTAGVIGQGRTILSAEGAPGGILGALYHNRPSTLYIASGLVVLAIAMIAFKDWFGDQLRKKITALVSIETSVATLRDYFLCFNPYFNYAIRVEDCYFLILDTGHDCLTGQSFWDDGGKKLGPITVRDNIIGGSPDTMAFFPPNEYYPYSQINWLEANLKLISHTHAQKAGAPRNCRVVVCVHTPPANLSKQDCRRADQLLSENNGNPVLMKRGGLEGFDVRFGTINHYLSQFYYLCLGYRETDQQTLFGSGVDLVLAGHAHWNIEFRLKRPADAGSSWDPLIHYGKFSAEVEQKPTPPHKWWDPLLLQTGACGPPSDAAPNSPYFRYITIDPELAIETLQPRHLR
jgi:hypothetical protein